jgi:hypothetical protein
VRIVLRVSGARAGLARGADELRVNAAEPPRLHSMCATEDLVATIAKDFSILAAKSLADPQRLRRRKGFTEEGEVCSRGEVPDLVSRMPAAAGGLETVLDIEGLAADANASIGERVRLHAGKERGRGLTGRHLAQLRSG